MWEEIGAAILGLEPFLRSNVKEKCLLLTWVNKFEEQEQREAGFLDFGLTKIGYDTHDLLSAKVIKEENIQEKVSQKVKG